MGLILRIICVLVMVTVVLGGGNNYDLSSFYSECNFTTTGLLVGPVVSLVNSSSSSFDNNVNGGGSMTTKNLLLALVYRTVGGTKQPYLAIYDYNNMALLDLVCISTSTVLVVDRISILSSVINFLTSLTAGVKTVNVFVLKSDNVLPSTNFRKALLLLDLVDTVEIVPRNDSIRSAISNLRLLINK